MTIETRAREFRYDGVRLPDPNPKLSIEDFGAIQKFPAPALQN
jgi:PRTRC genetic system protein C